MSRNPERTAVLRAVLTATLALLLACERPAPRTTPGAVAPADRGPLDRFECNRCHVIDGVPKTTVNLDCRECHRQIITRTYPEHAEHLATWDRGLENMRDVPSLVAADRRFDRGWFVEFVQNPHDLRPRLGATMPRLAIGPDDANALADALGLTESIDAGGDGDAAAGRALFNTRGCGACHAMSGLVEPIEASAIAAELDADTLARATLLAPDLRHTRDRFHRTTLEAWLRDPAAIKSDALMPVLGLGEKEARDLATFVLTAPLRPRDPTPPFERLPPLTRPVKWEEVQTRLVDEICLHCHSDPKYNEGDGGPGNTGGFGYAGKKLDLSSYSRAIADRSFFALAEDGTPKMVAHLLARHEEAAGRRGAVLGMPLGFPPIDAERIQLLESWIVQGLGQ